MRKNRDKKLEEVRNRFMKKFGRGVGVGVINGDSGGQVRLIGFSLSVFCTTDRAKEYGCPAGEKAILVMYYRTAEHPDLPQDKKRKTMFPKRFEGVPVYYLKTEPIRAF